jgi:hypothetical protein
LIGDQEALLVNHRWKLYSSDNTWSGLDIARLKLEQPEIFERYFVSKRPTGTKKLRVYAIHDGKGA